MKYSDYAENISIEDTDLLLIDNGDNGTRCIEIKYLFTDMEDDDEN